MNVIARIRNAANNAIGGIDSLVTGQAEQTGTIQNQFDYNNITAGQNQGQYQGQNQGQNQGQYQGQNQGQNQGQGTSDVVAPTTYNELLRYRTNCRNWNQQMRCVISKCAAQAAVDSSSVPTVNELRNAIDMICMDNSTVATFRTAIMKVNSRYDPKIGELAEACRIEMKEPFVDNGINSGKNMINQGFSNKGMVIFLAYMLIVGYIAQKSIMIVGMILLLSLVFMNKKN